MPLNRNNLKQTPIPVVPRTMKIVNPDGTVTRSGQLLLEQLQPMEALDEEAATFVLYDTAVGMNVTNLLPVQRSGVAIDAEIVPKATTTADFTFDILLTRASEPFATRTSIFGPTKLTCPAGTPAGTVIKQETFVADPYPIEINDVLSSNILEGDGSGIYTVVLSWRVRVT